MQSRKSELLLGNFKKVFSLDRESQIPVMLTSQALSTMHFRRLSDRQEILAFLNTDRLYAAYAIGDLEPPLFAQSDWYGAVEEGALCSIALLFKGLKPPALFLMGESDGLVAILSLGLRSTRVFVTCREQHLPVVRAFYYTETPAPMWRMTMTQTGFKPFEMSEVFQLSPRHTEDLTQLYAQGGGDAFSPMQLATGVFFGVRKRGHIVAAAGIHLVSEEYGMAAVGNVYTRKDFRGLGYGSATTSAVVGELYQRGLSCIFLNVAQDNSTAIRIYERLGFQRYCPFVEMLGVRKA